jgi:hypothetical protein
VDFGAGARSKAVRSSSSWVWLIVHGWKLVGVDRELGDEIVVVVGLKVGVDQRGK